MSHSVEQINQQCSHRILVPIYITAYTLLGIWLLIDGWLSGFSNICRLWSLDVAFPMHVQYLFFTMIGSLLGCSLLGITSFHRYVAIEKKFDADHLWGFFLAPLLAVVVGLLIFSLLQSGLVVLTNQTVHSEPIASVTATFGYLAIGAVSGYNWDVFIKKLQELSANVMNTAKYDESVDKVTTDTTDK